MSTAKDIALLKRAIKKSGLSRKQYAELVLLCTDRTLRRWISGQNSIKPQVLAFLERETQEQDEPQEVAV